MADEPRLNGAPLSGDYFPMVKSMVEMMVVPVYFGVLSMQEIGCNSEYICQAILLSSKLLTLTN